MRKKMKRGQLLVVLRVTYRRQKEFYIEIMYSRLDES